MSTQITKAEFAVMDVLWRASPIAAADVADQLADDTGWSLKTVKTLLGRLVDKGAAAYEEDGRRYIYSPAIARADYERSAASALADQLFGGRAAPLVAHLADGRGLSDDDIAELEALIAELKHDDR